MRVASVINATTTQGTPAVLAVFREVLTRMYPAQAWDGAAFKAMKLNAVVNDAVGDMQGWGWVVTYSYLGE